jgi:uncharacterized membrane protein YraQ (UPF0718 family)
MSLRDRLGATSWSGVLKLVFGAQWGQRIVIGTALVLYTWLALTRPSVASASARRGLATFVQLLTLILASLLIASALEQVVPRETVASYLGETAGAKGVVLAGLLGGLLPGGPYATYPIIKSVADRGASYPAMVTMLIGYSLIGVGRVPFGLGIFEARIVAIRLTVAVIGTTALGLTLHAISNTGLGGRVLSYRNVEE